MSLLNTIFSNPAFCDFVGPTYLLFSSNVPHLVYYSHIPITIVSLILGLFVFFKNKKGLPNRILFCLTLAFSAWVFLDSIFWASNRSDVIMFVWSLQILFEPLVYISGLYLLYVLIKKKDFPFGQKLLVALFYVPLILLVSMKYTLSAFNVSTCLSEEGPIALYYTYAIEIFYAIWLIGFSTKEFIMSRTAGFRGQIAVLTTGTVLLLLAFSSGNIISSFTEDWQFAQIGLFTMPVFIGILVYGIVKFKTFDIKLIGAQALIVSLVILIGSQFFFIQNDTNRVLTAITLVITGGIGINLIRSVKKEVEQREKIEKQEKELEVANERLKELDQLKSEFVSLATHQIRGPLTSIKGYASMMLEGDYGEVPKELKDPVDTIYQSSQSLVVIVEDFLNVSRIEQGKMKYDFTEFDFCALVNEVVNEARPITEKRGLNVSATICPAPVNVNGDRGKLKQVVGNLLDNSMKYTPVVNVGDAHSAVSSFANSRADSQIKQPISTTSRTPPSPTSTTGYTPKGSITLTLDSDKANKKVLLSIKDTGVGISAQTIPHLFQKFSRASDASKVNILGTGLGLYVASEMIKAHGGKIWVESPGEGKGSTFFVELALV